MTFDESEGGAGDEPGKKRKRRRRRRGPGEAESTEAQPLDVRPPREAVSDDRGARPRGRRLVREDGDAAGVAIPASGKMVNRPRIHKKRWKPASGMARRRAMSRVQFEDLVVWFQKLPEPILTSLYKALGGQMSRGVDAERMIQLTVRALAQGNRLGGLLAQVHQRDRQALAALVQCGGLAQADEFHKELAITLGGREHDWARTMQALSDRGLVCASGPVPAVADEGFYYLVPEPLIDPLLAQLGAELELSTFDHEEIRVIDQRPFCPPIDFSLATLATWLDQRPPRLTQRQEVFKQHKDDLDRFFAQVWAPDSEVFNIHYDFLTLHGMIELRGDRIAVNRDVVEEWLQLEPDDQRDLVFRALDQRFPMAEWVLWAIHGGGGEWIPEAPLQAIYRRWKRGEDWRERFHKDLYVSSRGPDRDTYAFTPLIACGMVELGVWGQQKFYRLSPRAKALLEPAEDEGFSKFYLTPSYEIMAPAGLAPMMLFRIGEIAELVGCDRANTYKITEVSIEQALTKGWRREELLDFLRDYSQIGLPENVEHTLRGWMGQEGDVEFHDIMALTVHRSVVKRFEASRGIKSFVLHRFAPGLYAVDPRHLPEISAELQRLGFNPASEVRRYPADDQALGARERLHHLLAEAREIRDDPVSRAHSADTQPDELRPVPGSASAHRAQVRRGGQPPPRSTPQETRVIVERAIQQSFWLEVLYLSAKDQTRRDLILVPERLALNREGSCVLVAFDTATGTKLSYPVEQIERVRSIPPRNAR